MILSIFIIFGNCNRDVDNTTSKNGSYKSVDVGYYNFMDKLNKIKKRIKDDADKAKNQVDKKINQFRGEMKKRDREQEEERKKMQKQMQSDRDMNRKMRIHEIRSSSISQKRISKKDNWGQQIIDFSNYLAGAKSKNKDLLLSRVNDKFQIGLIRFVIDYEGISLDKTEKELFFKQMVKRSNNIQLSAIDKYGKALLHYLIETRNLALLEILLEEEKTILEEYFDSAEKEGFLGRHDKVTMRDDTPNDNEYSIEMIPIPEYIITEHKKKYLYLDNVTIESDKKIITNIYTYLLDQLIKYFKTEGFKMYGEKYLVRGNEKIPEDLRAKFKNKNT